MLEEVYVAAGEVLQHRTAVSVDDLAVPADTDFAIEDEPLAVDAGGIEVEPIDAASAPVVGYWELSDVPVGYEHAGRYVVREEDPDAPATDSTTTTTSEPATAFIASFVDVYVSGSDVIVVHQGPEAAQPSGDVTSAPSSESAVFGTVQLAPGVAGTTALAHPTEPAGWFVQVTATMPRAELAALVERFVATS